MKRVFSTFILTIICNFIFGQEVKFYNENFLPVKYKRKANPVFFSETLESDNMIEESIYTLNDTILLRKKTVELDENGKAFKELISKFNSDGRLKYELNKNLETGFTISQEFNTNGKAINRKLISGSQIHEDLFFDENGVEIKKLSEQQAEPYMGMKGWNEYIRSNIRYPKEARGTRRTDRVSIYFTINEFGEINDIEILNPEEVHIAIAKEALRIMKNYPHNWSPYILNGEPRKKELIMPIVFNNLGIINRY